MATRAILLIALIAFPFTEIIRAGDPPTLPSRKASVVMPLLRQYAPKDYDGKKTLDELTSILGKCDSVRPYGPGDEEAFYQLDDKTQIIVNWRSGKLFKITERIPDQGEKVLLQGKDPNPPF